MPALDLAACAPHVHPVTMERVIAVESGGNQLALHVNRYSGPQPRATSATDAAWLAKAFISKGFTVDIGLAQVNSANLPGLGYTVEEVLDPCTNVHAGAAILFAAYAKALDYAAPGQSALRVALSVYNTGTVDLGFKNGYVSRYYSTIPAIYDIHLPDSRAESAQPAKREKPKPVNVFAADSQAWYATALLE